MTSHDGAFSVFIILEILLLVLTLSRLVVILCVWHDDKTRTVCPPSQDAHAAPCVGLLQLPESPLPHHQQLGIVAPQADTDALAPPDAAPAIAMDAPPPPMANTKELTALSEPLIETIEPQYIRDAFVMKPKIQPE